DGVILQAIEDPALGDGNTLDLSWDISELDAGNYNLAVEVTDELGLEGASEPLAMTIEVQRPQLVEATAEAGGDNAVVEVEAEENAEPAASGFDWANLTSSIWFWVVVGVVSIFGVILFFMLLLAIVRRSGKKKGEGQVEPQVQPQAALDAEATQILAPAFVQRGSGAYLEPMENASEHAGAVYLSGNNVAMGRDPKLAQIVFKDKSVSRLHARIMESNGEYRLYDEGSA
ncbi:MAG: FHA domain-containing protein, partial [Anaerolineales bacterium]|nr:FHA domain-containing protein [Anaerolineales bacterium]